MDNWPSASSSDAFLPLGITLLFKAALDYSDASKSPENWYLEAKQLRERFSSPLLSKQREVPPLHKRGLLLPSCIWSWGKGNWPLLAEITGVLSKTKAASSCLCRCCHSFRMLGPRHPPKVALGSRLHRVQLGSHSQTPRQKTGCPFWKSQSPQVFWTVFPSMDIGKLSCVSNE